MKDMSIPERIYITTRSVNKKIKLWWYEIVFKTLSWRYQWKKINLYGKFSEYRKEISIEGMDFKISGLELALLEAALVEDMYEWVDVWLLVRTIKKYGAVFNRSTFNEIGKYKYNMSYNRLKEISKTINIDLYNIFLDIIKKNWWCFVGEGLRGI